MAKFRLRALVFGFFALALVASSTATEVDEDTGILDCFSEVNSLACAKKRADEALDNIESNVTGRQTSVGISKVFDEAGEIIVDVSRSLFGDDAADDDEDAEESQSGYREARKKFGKKKKKMLQKLMAFSMLIKSKISLILQLISTHVQMKFFAIAIISLIINIARFWMDVKKDSHGSKVVYYEHAQHQHHYDHDDDHHGGYWGRSDEGWMAQPLAYNAHQQE